MDRLGNEQKNEQKPPPTQNGELDNQVKEEPRKALEKDNKMKQKN